MIIGVPKEIKEVEYRVALTPAGVRALSEAEHRVFVEKGAGEGSGFSDEEFQKSRTEIIRDEPRVFVACYSLEEVGG